MLVLGGYGGFGARISRRIARAGYRVVVAGRSQAKANRFCEGEPAMISAAFDRADIEHALATIRPNVVVDASGPFQAMDYSVPKACIAARIHYCDIADGRDFVCEIASLDAEARAANVAVVSGASSVPALSGAVVRELASGLDRIQAVEMAISASNRATAGPSVAASILSQVGQPMTVRRAGRWATVYGWQEMTRLDFSIIDMQPLRGRLVGLANVPDITLLPNHLPESPSVTFRAGTELSYQNRTLWLVSWLVRWGLIRSLPRRSRLLLPFQKLTSKMGSDRSGMMIRLFGSRLGVHIERRWTLIAEDGDGPEIPSLSVPPLIERILSGKEPSGARDAGSCLALADYKEAFAGLHIHHETQEIVAPPSLYKRVMGQRFEPLPRAVREMHEVWRDSGAEGKANVTGANNWLGRALARFIGFPPPGDVAVHVAFAERDGIERWTRTFGQHSFSSELSQLADRLVERFGPLRFQFDLETGDGNLLMIMTAWSMFNVPMPLVLAPQSRAREWEAGGLFHFDVPIALPMIGKIIHYRGWLRIIRSGASYGP